MKNKRNFSKEVALELFLFILGFTLLTILFNYDSIMFYLDK